MRTFEIMAFLPLLNRAELLTSGTSKKVQGREPKLPMRYVVEKMWLWKMTCSAMLA
jgi:hypothetical protein